MPQKLIFTFPNRSSPGKGGSSDGLWIVGLGVVFLLLYLKRRNQEPRKTLPYDFLIRNTALRNKATEFQDKVTLWVKAYK